MNNSNKSTKFVNYFYVIKEMSEEVEKTTENLKTVIEGQEKLVNYLEASEDKAMFEGFINELKKGTENYKEQLRVLTYRLDITKTIISEFSDIKSMLLVSLLLEAIGAANKEAKTIEERESNKEDTEDYKVA